MAEAFFNRRALEMGLPARAVSAGTAPGARINPDAARAMEEAGISLQGQAPKQLTAEMALQSDRVITMGCGVEASNCPAGTFISEDWGLPDPHGQEIEGVRRVRDAVERKVRELLEELAAAEIQRP